MISFDRKRREERSRVQEQQGQVHQEELLKQQFLRKIQMFWSWRGRDKVKCRLGLSMKLSVFSVEGHRSQWTDIPREG